MEKENYFKMNSREIKRKNQTETKRVEAFGKRKTR